MVLYKRKPVKFDPLPEYLDDNTEIWGIEETGEVYTDYEKFLKRRDFYDQRAFTCESTGHSSFTFFEALESEAEASREIDSIFPEGLRSRVLHFVQFMNTPRMDDLVNLVFDHFREHFMIGDRVSVEGENGARRYGVITDIREANQYTSYQKIPDDQFRSVTYVISMEDNEETITRMKASELQRDRKVYSKLILKQFLRSTVSRESWIGAPWLAKGHLTKRYGIPTKIPDNKTRDAIMAQKKATLSTQPNGASPPAQYPYPPPNNGPQVNGHRPAPGYGPGPGFVNYSPGHGQTPMPPHMVAHIQGPNRQYVEHQPPGMIAPPHAPHHAGPHPGHHAGHHPGHPTGPHAGHHTGPHAGPPPGHAPQMPPTGGLPPNLANILNHPAGPSLPVSLPFQNGFMQYQRFAPPHTHKAPAAAPQVKPVEHVKYPTEDLEIPEPKLNLTRPTLKFFNDDVPEGVEEPEEGKKTGILMKSIGPLLCLWETLNVHDTIYDLDSFTFDDFVDAMRYSSEDVDCELQVEVHCSVLKQVVNYDGKLQVALPSMVDAEDSEEEESDEEESEPTPEPEPPARSTRSSLRKSEAQMIVEKARTPTPEPPKEVHRAADFVADYDWIEQIKIRNFINGGWQASFVALLYRLSFDPAQKEACDEILAELVPPDEDPTIESISANYCDMDVNLRIAALEMVLRLTVTTEAFRDQLANSSLEMTRLRKEKIDYQRKRKELADDLFKLDLERKIKLPENTPASPTEIKDSEDVSMISVTESIAETVEPEGNDSEDASTKRTRTKNKRKAAVEEARKEKAKKAKIEAEKNKKQKEWEKLLNSIDKKRDELKECEAKIIELDDDLRECMVHRSKILGKDRFMNKYYWFEHNGMPFGGVPDSSTAEYGYANGRVWVQGPDQYELAPNLEEPALTEDMQRFGFTVPQRKEKEEGSTHLVSSTEWGYYDDPSDIEQLIGWLDDRGVREKALRKELQTFRSRITEYMIKMKEHLVAEDAESEEEDEEEAKPRTSTRSKTQDKDEPKERCLQWTNSIMREQHGHNHAEEYEPPRKGRARAVKATRGRGRK